MWKTAFLQLKRWLKFKLFWFSTCSIVHCFGDTLGTNLPDLVCSRDHGVDQMKTFTHLLRNNLLTPIKGFGVAFVLLAALTSMASAQSQPNYGPNAPANADSFGQPPTGTRPPGVSRTGHRAYAYVPHRHYHRPAYRYYRY